MFQSKAKDLKEEHIDKEANKLGNRAKNHFKKEIKSCQNILSVILNKIESVEKDFKDEDDEADKPEHSWDCHRLFDAKEVTEKSQQILEDNEDEDEDDLFTPKDAQD